MGTGDVIYFYAKRNSCGNVGGGGGEALNFYTTCKGNSFGDVETLYFYAKGNSCRDVGGGGGRYTFIRRVTLVTKK